MYKNKTNLIILISGVPSAGKTTISYELLRRINCFRIVQETDILREILRGYNQFLVESLPNIAPKIDYLAPHTELLSYNKAKSQCKIMKNSIIEVINRQNRKQISTIICGVHIIPEILYEDINSTNVKYINLYFDCKEDLYSHLKTRDTDKYGKKSVDFLYNMNVKLQNNFSSLQFQYPHMFTSINVGKLTVEETIDFIIDFLEQ